MNLDRPNYLYKFGMIMLLVTSALSRAWMPYVIENENKIKEVLIMLVIFSVGMLLLTIIYILGIHFFFYKIVPVEYHVGITVAYIITVGYLFDGVCKLINAIFTVKSKISIYIRITIFSGGVNIVLNCLLIPEFGYIGSAYATLTSFLVALLIAVVVMYNLMNSEWS